ncbi:uncharacterized protein [Nicotiana tomentosiformis]|uniref:uncharacterized protein n=1 Tax=Nicotiana tomentosiformis TaxID=4098 RepID=UPI00388CA611
MTVTQYEMRFAELARHAVWLVTTEREKIRRFIDGLNYGLHFIMAWKVATGVRFDQVVYIARLLNLVHIQEYEEREAKRPRSLVGFSSASFGGQSHQSRGHPYRLAQMAHPVHRGASASHGSYSVVWGSAVPGSSSGYSGSQGPIQSLMPFVDRGFYECGELGNVRKYFPHIMGGPVQQSGQAMTSPPVTSPPAQPAPGGTQVVRGRPREGDRSSGGRPGCIHII